MTNQDTTPTLEDLPYPEYLQSSHWRDLRTEMLEWSGYRCMQCASAKPPLHVHHTTYERRGCERYTDLMVLCADCHNAIHEKDGL